MPRGYTGALYMLPFDHRASFETGLFGWKPVPVTVEPEPVEVPATEQDGAGG